MHFYKLPGRFHLQHTGYGRPFIREADRNIARLQRSLNAPAV
jgi:hypothetical protein